MLPVTTAHLPGVIAQCHPADRSASEILAHPPGRGGDHWWIRVAKTDMGTQQARAAIARSVGIAVDAVACAGNRDRAGRCLQWFSVPAALVDAPGPLRRAGAHGKMQVLEVTRSHLPMSAEAVQRLHWTLRLRQGAAQDGYRLLQARMDVLRQQGMANYSAHGARDHAQLARWGRLLVLGRRLPAAVARRLQAGPCLRAFQDSVFNRAVAMRLSDGLLHRVLPGDRLRDRRGGEFLAEDPALAQRRVDSWEAVVLGPCFGTGMAPAAGEAAAREAALLAGLGLPAAGIARLHGYRRAVRVQPTQVHLDISGADLEVQCELPLDAGIAVLLAHLLAPAAGSPTMAEVDDAGLEDSSPEGWSEDEAQAADAGPLADAEGAAAEEGGAP
jgi:tRNA pseudouridine13 synthase